MNLNKRQQLLAILAIVAVGLFVADKLVFSPLTKAWDARSKRIASLKEEVRAGKETIKFDRAWREQWDLMRTNTLSNQKPVAESQMLKAFERWARESNVSVSSIRPQWKEAEDDYKTVECRADVAGNLSTISHFLYQVEHEPLGVKVDSMELTSRSPEGAQLALVIQVSGLVINPAKPSATQTQK